MTAFSTFKTLKNAAPKMAHTPLTISVQSEVCEVPPKGHSSIDSFDRLGSGARTATILSQFVSMNPKAGVKIDGGNGRQGVNSERGGWGANGNAATISLKDLAQFSGTTRATGGIEAAGAGRGSSKDILGGSEPGSGLYAGVQSGSVDKQGNASSVPRFGADSRLATDWCQLSKEHKATQKAFSPFSRAEQGGTGLAFVGLAYAKLCADQEAASTANETNKEDDKKAAEKTSKEPEVTGGQTGETGTCEEDVPSSTAQTTGCENPEDDRSGSQLNDGEIEALGNAAYESLAHSSDPDADYAGMDYASELSPENMRKKRQESYSRPSGEEERQSGGPLAGIQIGTTADGLIQNFQNDIAGTGPTTSGDDNQPSR